MDLGLDNRVERAGRLVEQQQRAAAGGVQAARQRQALALSARQVHAALGERGRQAGRQRGQHVGQAAHGDRPLQRRFVGDLAQGQVLGDRRLEDIGLLRNQGGDAAQVPHAGRHRTVDPVVAARGPVQAGEQAQQRALAGAARPDQRDALATTQGQHDVLERAGPARDDRHAQRRRHAVERSVEAERDALDRLPAGFDDRGLGPGLGRRPDGVAARKVDPRPRQGLHVQGDAAEDAAGLLAVLVDHEDAADEQRAATVAGRPGVGDDQTPGEAEPEQIDRAPLDLGDHDAAPQGDEHRLETAAEQLAGAGLQAQADHRAEVADEVEQAGGVAAVGAVLFVGQPHQRAVEADDDQGDRHEADEGDEPGRCRQQRQRDHRPDQADRALQVDELALRKTGQRHARLVDPALDLRRMLGFAPGQRRARQLGVQRVRQAPAHLHADIALEDAARPVQGPGHHVDQADRGDHPAGTRCRCRAVLLQGVDCLRGQPGHRQLDDLRRSEQRRSADQRDPLAAGVLPQTAVELRQRRDTDLRADVRRRQLRFLEIQAPAPS